MTRFALSSSMMGTKLLRSRFRWTNGTTITSCKRRRLVACSSNPAGSSTGGIKEQQQQQQLRRDIVDMNVILNQHGVRLTDAEFVRLRHAVDANRDGLISRAELAKASKRAVEDRATREVCLSVIELPNAASPWDRMVSQYAVRACDVGGTLLYAVAGTQVAGDVGMNVVGCTLVGCATALGGGTLNNLLHGASTPLHGKPGVFWVCQPEYLFMAAGASLATFFLWPWYCQQQADAYLKDMIGESNLQKSNGSVGRRAFIRTCRRNPEFLETMQNVISKAYKQEGSDDDKDTGNNNKPTPERIFDLLDSDQSGSLNRDKLRRLTQGQFDNSFETYVVDSVALAGFAVAAAHGGIRAGVHPVVAASAGVTICFGGIVRDVLCGRSIAIGAQSYAFATGAGATVYVALREAAVRGWLPNSLVARILLTAGTTIGLRFVEYKQGHPFLAPMHGKSPRELVNE